MGSKRYSTENQLFVAVLQNLKRDKDWHNKQLALYLDVPHSTVDFWLNFKRAPRPSTRQRILDLIGFECPPGALATVESLQSAVAQCQTADTATERDQLCISMGFLLYRHLLAHGIDAEFVQRFKRREVAISCPVSEDDVLILQIYPALGEIRQRVFIKHSGADMKPFYDQRRICNDWFTLFSQKHEELVKLHEKSRREQKESPFAAAGRRAAEIMYQEQPPLYV